MSIYVKSAYFGRFKKANKKEICSGEQGKDTLAGSRRKYNMKG